MNAISLPDDVWNEIKSYIGIYTIPKKFKKLGNLTLPYILEIVKKYSNQNVENTKVYARAKQRMESMKQFLIKYFWRSMLNHKEIVKQKYLQEIYQTYIEYPFSSFVIGETVFIYGYQTSYIISKINKKSLEIVERKRPEYKRFITFMPSKVRPPIKYWWEQNQMNDDLDI